MMNKQCAQAYWTWCARAGNAGAVLECVHTIAAVVVSDGHTWSSISLGRPNDWPYDCHGTQPAPAEAKYVPSGTALRSS